MIQQALKLNMIPESAPVVLNVDQYDTGTGRIVAQLYNGATPYTPGAGATAKIQGTKPDMHGFQYDATLSGSTVTADLEQQMSCVAGNVRTQIVITETSGRTGTFAFIMRVQASALDDDTDISETVLPDIIDAAEHNADRAEAAADRAEAASLHYPYIGANKNWYEWDPATEQYIDTGIKAEGSVYNAGLGIDITGDVISVDSDNTPTDGSMKPITSNAVYDGLATKQDNLTAGSFIDITSNVISATYTDATQNDSGLMSAADKTKLDGIESGAEVNVQADWNEADNTKDDYIKNKPTLGTAAAKDATNAVTSGSTDLVESGAVKTAIDTAISAVYKPAGDKTCAELTASLLVAANLGNVYNTTDAGTTTADFVGGAGRTISIGDNVAIVDVGGGTYKFDLLAGMVDLTAYQTKNLTTAVESQSTVEGALGALSSNKQPKTLSSAITVDGTQETTVESALSAINTLAAANKTNKQDKTLSSTIESQSTVEGALSALSSNKQPKTLSTPITVDGTSETTVEGTLGAINDLAAANKTAIGNLGTAAAKDATDTIASGSTDLIESGAVYTALNGKQDTLSAGTGIDITSNTVSVDADATPTDGSNKPVTSNGVYDALALKQNSLTFDNTPTDGSTNPVTSDGIYEALALKQDTLTFDNVPTASSANPVKSGGVYDADQATRQLLDDTVGWESNNLWTGTIYKADYSYSSAGYESPNTDYDIYSITNVIAGIYNFNVKSNLAYDSSIRFKFFDSSDTQLDFITVIVPPNTTSNFSVIAPVNTSYAYVSARKEMAILSFSHITVDEQKYNRSEANILGAKNLLDYSLEDLKSYNTIGTWSGNVYTRGNITFTVNNDKSITVNGSQSNNNATSFYFTAPDSSGFQDRIYSVGSYISGIFDAFYSADGEIVSVDNANGVLIPQGASNPLILGIRVYKNQTVGTVTVKPMIRLATDTDPTYQPYAQTNRELTVNKAEVTAISDDDETGRTTASRLFYAGEYFYKDGRDCIVTQQTAAGGTWTLNGNYKYKTVNEALKDIGKDISAGVNSLDDIPIGMGIVGLPSSLSPSGGNLTVCYVCFGALYSTITSRTLIVTRVSTGETFVNARHEGSWLGWKKITFTT